MEQFTLEGRIIKKKLNKKASATYSQSFVNTVLICSGRATIICKAMVTATLGEKEPIMSLGLIYFHCCFQHPGQGQIGSAFNSAAPFYLKTTRINKLHTISTPATVMI